ncbi:excisionase family DNA-binding protein [Ornithinimicrobium kibberense]
MLPGPFSQSSSDPDKRPAACGGETRRRMRRACGGMATTTRTATAMSSRRYETLAAAADRTGISVKTLRRRIADGSLPAYRTGRRIIRVSPEEVDGLLKPVPSSVV